MPGHAAVACQQRADIKLAAKAAGQQGSGRVAAVDGMAGRVCNVANATRSRQNQGVPKHGRSPPEIFMEYCCSGARGLGPVFISWIWPAGMADNRFWNYASD